MKKRISALCLCGAVCVSMFGTTASAALSGSNASDYGFTEDGDYRVTVVDKDVPIDRVDITVEDGKITSGSLGDHSWSSNVGFIGSDGEYHYLPSGGDDGNNGGSNNGGNTSSGSTGSSSSSTPSGGAAGASSKYITNTQPVTEKPADTGVDSGWTSNSSGRFSDVPAGEWYYDAVLYVGSNGIMAGSNGLFSPNDNLTRGMMAQILYNIEGAPGGTSAVFPDVSSTDWFASAATWASSCGYMSGYGNGNFGPLDPITREQLATILFRYAGSKGYSVTASATLTFPDAGTTSDWARPAMQWAVGAGLLSGKTGVAGTRLDPLGNATRAEVAQILMNFMLNVAK